MSTATDKNIESDDRTQLRRSVYWLLILLGTGLMLGRIAAVDDVGRTAADEYRYSHILGEKKNKLRNLGLEGEEYEKALQWEKDRLDEKLPPTIRRPFLSANDRSRWCMVRALVDEDMRVEGHPYSIDKVIQEYGWDTIDMVKHDGHCYSSKPPLFPTIMAGEYWLLKKTTGWNFREHPFLVVRVMLAITNLIPLLIYFILLSRLIERFGKTDWGRIFVMGAAVFGTFLSTFVVTINNHLPAAICVLIATYALVRIWFDDERRWRYFVIVGLFAAGTAANELPALSILGLISLALLWKAPKQTLIAYVPAVVLVGAAFLGTNWIAHNDLKPPYLHRSEGDNWYDYEYTVRGETKQSYWNNPSEIDQGEKSFVRYAVHVLVGHHGIFSLTPVWILSVAGLIMWLLPGKDPKLPDKNLRDLAILIGVTSAVCLAFYLARPVHHRNYGGITSGLRWMFWFAPLWLLVMLPAADWMARRTWTKVVAGIMLVASVFSVSYPIWNPWTHPWITDYLQYWCGVS